MTLNEALISEITLNQTTASVTIPVPSGYTDLRLVMSLRTDIDATPGVIYFNSDTTNTNYNVIRVLGEGTGAGSSASANYPYIYYMDTSARTASTFSSHEIYIPSYAVSGIQKSFFSDFVSENNAAYVVQGFVGGKWSGTGAITSMQIKPYNEGGANFVAGCTFTLYGIAALGTNPTQTPKATGGDIIKNDGTYWYHAFLSTGAFIPQTSISADVLVVAGGGGGAGQNAAAGGSGGGGAGGLLSFTSQSLIATSYTCTIGAGGAGGGSASNGTTGVDSQFGALTLVKGGGYGAKGGSGSTGGNGGSGGGGAYGGTAGGSATSGQGNAGAAGTTFQYSGGGGGAGAAGSSQNGGVGVSTYSSWGLATTTGQNVAGTVYYAGGGSGAGGNAQVAAPNGGGGYGGTSGSGGNGIANTGGGGGGGGDSYYYGNTTGGSGGSGIIIVRYAMA